MLQDNKLEFNPFIEALSVTIKTLPFCSHPITKEHRGYRTGRWGRWAGFSH